MNFLNELDPSQYILLVAIAAAVIIEVFPPDEVAPFADFITILGALLLAGLDQCV